MNLSHIIASSISIPLGLMLGFFLAKITLDEKEVIKKYHKQTIFITVIMFLLSIFAFSKTKQLFTILIALLLTSMVTGVLIHTYKKENTKHQKKQAKKKQQL